MKIPEKLPEEYQGNWALYWMDQYDKAFPDDPFNMRYYSSLANEELIDLIKKAIVRNKPYSHEEWNEIFQIPPDALT